MSTNIPTVSLFNLGLDLFGQVQRTLGASKVRALRLKLGSHVIKEIPVSPLTTIATIILVALAVIISAISIEVDHEPSH